MTTSKNPDTTLDDAPTVEDVFDIDAYLGGATVMTASVDIVRNAGLLGEYAAWERRYEQAKADQRGIEERSFGDPDLVLYLEDEGRALRFRIAADTSTWHVRALSLDEQQGILDAHPLPTDPPLFTEPTPRLVPQPTEAQAQAFLKATQAWEARRDRFNTEHRAERDAYEKAAYQVAKARRAETISLAVARIEVAGRVIAEAGEERAITAAQADALTRQIGEAQVNRLQEAIALANTAEPEVPAAFLPPSSGTGRI